MSNPSFNPYAAPQAAILSAPTNIETPRLAGRLTRLAASFLNGLSFLIAAAPMLLVPEIRNEAFQLATDEDAGSWFAENLIFLVIVSIVLLLGLLVWNIWLLTLNGQTLGKKICGIKIVRSDFQKASFGRLFWMRIVANGLLGMIPFLGSLYSLVDVLFIFSTNRQCLHDLIADTIVVEAKSVGLSHPFAE